MAQPKNNASQAISAAVSLELEQLEPRLLFSADNPFALGAAVLGGNAMGPTTTHLPVTQLDRATEQGQQSAASQRSGATTHPERQSVSTVVFLDSRVPDADRWLAELRANADDSTVIHILDAERDGLDQMSDWLQGYADVSAVHVITHAEDGAVLAGAGEITQVDLLQQADSLMGWRDALTSNADVLIYGCDLAATSKGQQWVSTFSQLTSTDVAASNDLTGAAALGGDWQLEHRTGDITTELAVGSAFQNSYRASLATFIVTTLDDNGPGSLRAAIDAANLNASGSIDVIRFDVAGTVTLLSALPDISDGVSIDASSAPGHSSSPVVVIDGTNLATGNGLSFVAGSDGSAVRHLQIVNFPDNGIAVLDTDQIEITNNTIGTDGTSNLGNGGSGVLVSNSSNVTIGGVASTFANVISGNGQDGIRLTSLASNTVVQGNFIGTDGNGSVALGNGDSGVSVEGGSTGTLIGGDRLDGRGNLISGNAGAGVFVGDVGTSNTRIEGNVIGLNAAMTAALENRDGIHVVDADNTTIGQSDGRGNVISGNQFDGIKVEGNNTGLVEIVGNQIGTDAPGTTDLGNGLSGIGAASTSVVLNIGSATTGLNNVISGNDGTGIWLSAVNDVNVIGNYIGTTGSGNAALGNGSSGIFLNQVTGSAVIGAAVTGGGNVISANANNGIIYGFNTSDTVIVNNIIGVSLNGLLALGNGSNGILLAGSGNRVGGVTAAERNTIANNGQRGIAIDFPLSDNNSLLGNLIYWNNSQSVDLGADGRDMNDVNDADDGTNSHLNYPVIQQVLVETVGSVRVVGTLEGSALPAGYRLEFFGSASDGHAERFLGSTQVNNTPTGNISFDVTLASTIATGEYVVVMATEGTGVANYGRTSEFSVAVTADSVGSAPMLTSPLTLSVDENTTAIATLTAIDVDGPSLAYSITGGSDASLFSINPLTGQLSFNIAKNFESPADSNADGQYEVTLSVTDGSLSDTEDFIVTVNDVNEAPTIPGIPSFFINENTTQVTGSFTGVDADGDVLTYSIAPSPDALAFTIDSATGVLTAVTAPDFESPNDANGDNVYELTVVASDGSLSTSADIQVSVNDISDDNSAPTVAIGTPFTVDENTTIANGAFTTNDPDADALTFSLLPSADAGLFTINATTGELSLVAPPDFESPSDANSDGRYELIVQVSDGEFSASTDVGVTVNDVADTNQAPSIAVNVPFHVEENTTVVTGSFTTGDADGDSLTYSIAPSADAAAFTINATTGELSLNENADFEQPGDANGDGRYALAVQVSDGSQIAAVAFSVTIDNINEAPVISVATPYTALELTPSLTGGLDVHDPEGSALSFTLASTTDSALFRIDAQTGDLQLVAPLNFEQPSDANSDNSYELTVVASDGELTTTHDFVVVNSDVNEAPTAVAVDLTGAEDTLINAPELPWQDPDAGDTIEFYVVGGSAQDAFTIEPASGDIVQTTMLSEGQYTLQLEARDARGLATVVTLQVTIEAAPDAPAAAEPEAPDAGAPDIGTGNTGSSITDGGSLNTGGANNAGDSDSGNETGSGQSGGTDNGGGVVFTPTEESSNTDSNGGSDNSANVTVAGGGYTQDSVATQQILSAVFDGRDDSLTSNRLAADLAESGGENRASFAPRVFGTRLAIDILLEDLSDAAENIAAVFDVDIDPGSINIVYSTAMLDALDDLRETLDEDVNRSTERESLIVKAGTVASATLTVGFVTWVLRTGALLATAYSTSPLWRSIDPIPVLNDLQSLKDNAVDSPFHGLGEDSTHGGKDE